MPSGGRLLGQSGCSARCCSSSGWPRSRSSSSSCCRTRRRRRAAGRRSRSAPPLGLHGSVVDNYVRFLSKIVHGDLGTSTANGHSVTTIVTTAAPITAGLVLGGAVIWLAIAIPLGLLSALRPSSRAGKAGGVLAVVGLSLQPLWLGLVLSWLFGGRARLVPARRLLRHARPRARLRRPAAVGVPHGPAVDGVRVDLRSRVRAPRPGALTADVCATPTCARPAPRACPNGASCVRTCCRRRVRPMLSALVLDLGGMAFGLIGATLFVEVAFGIPGLGRTTAQAAVRARLPGADRRAAVRGRDGRVREPRRRPGRGASRTGRAPQPRADSGVGRYVAAVSHRAQAFSK